MKDLSVLDWSYIEQIPQDWSTIPMTSIIVQDSPCSDGMINVFRSMWNGTETGCYLSNPQSVMTLDEFNDLYEGESCE